MPDPSLFTLQRGDAPLLISIPHLGTELPEALRGSYTDAASLRADTDWHLDRVYAFGREMGASLLAARVSRYVIDLNRPATGESLYPGQTTTGLCPTETFRGEPLYHPGAEPDAPEVARRVEAYWQPYHQALRDELERLRQQHGRVLLWEAHSIASRLPRLFAGKLPDLNFGTNDGQACHPLVLAAALHGLPAAGTLSHVVNGRFKGGHITRAYGQPARGVHAIQLEMCQRLYMDETPPFTFREEPAARLAGVLRTVLGHALQALRRLPG